MDPMDYIMHNHPRSSGHYDPVHSASNHWMSHSQHSPSYPWQAQNPSLPQSYPHHPLQPAPGPVPDPFQLGHHGGMLPPMLGLPHPHAFSENMPGAVSPRPSGRHHQAYHRNAMPPPVAPVATGTGAAHNRDGAFANQIPGRPLSFQPPAGVGIPPPLGAGANAGAEANSQQQQQQQPPQPQRPPFPPAEPSTNNFGQHSNNSPHFVPVPVPLPPNPYISTPPPRRGHFSSASTSRTTFRDIPSPTRPSPPSSTFRRSHPRQRRAAPTRIMSSEPGREDDEDAARYTHPVPGMYSPGGSDSSSDGTDENAVRHLQLMRGTISTKMVASKTTLQSLQNIKIEDLPDADRCCIICYNDYGAESPEGLRESPLRLPKCGHTFGDYCIKKWLSESDSCPYCRDKLHSEPKPTTSPSARAFMNLMRSQGLHVSSRTNANPDDLLARAMAMSYGMPGRNATPPRQPTTSGRRSPPSDAGERQRRTRARHDSGHTRELRPLSGGHSRAAHVDTPLQRAAPGAPLIGHSFVHHWDEVPSMERQQQWTRERDPMPESQTGRVASSVSSPASVIATSALSPLAPMYQPQGVFIGLADRQPLGTAPSQNPRMPDIRNSLQVEGNENAAPSLTTPQELPGIIQGNSNRSW